MSICKLCLENKELIKKSHIIPEFMYQDLFDLKHKMFSFKPLKFAKGQDFVMRPSSGEYQGDLLCSNCDNKILGEFESYTKKRLFGNEINLNKRQSYKGVTNQNGVSYTTFNNVNYLKYKLFLLSILWRASISSRPFFAEIQLAEHEELVRKMILERNPSAITEYPILHLTYMNDEAMTSDIITQPRKIVTQSGELTYVFIIGGMIYNFYIPSPNYSIPNYVFDSTIKPSDDLTVIELPKGDGWEILKRYHGLR